MAELNNLISKRTTLKQQFTRYKNKLILEEASSAYLKMMLSKMEPLQEQLFAVDASISEIDENQSDSSYINCSLETIADLYEQIDRIKLNDKINNSNSGNNLCNVNLPRITLPKYDGTYEKWTAFRDTYISLIHSNKSLSTIEKFHYLKASLVDEAARLIESLELSDQNYDNAWQSLIDRYNNKKQIIKNHARALLSLPHTSKNNLRQTLDIVLKNIRALKACGEPVEQWSTLLIIIIISKLDYKLNEDWEAASSDIERPTFPELTEFLEKKCKIAEAINDSSHISRALQQDKLKGKKSFIASKIKDIKCSSCNADHSIRNCQKFLKLSTQKRFEFVKSKKLCINCLYEGHKLSQCNSSFCKSCGAKHNTLLHFEKLKNTEKENVPAEETVDASNDIISNDTCPSSSMHASNPSHVFLSTAIVHVKDNNGKLHNCRTLLDSGSQSNFISRDLLERLKIKEKTVDIPIIGISNVAKRINKSVKINVHSSHNNYTFSSQFLVLDRISDNMPNFSMSKGIFEIPPHIKLADPEFNTSGKIDMLIGAEIFFNLMSSERIIRKGYPTLQKTRLGWVVAGAIYNNVKNVTTSCNFVEIDSQLEKFWDIEEVPRKFKFNKEEQYCEEHFEKTHSRDINGRFIVELPFKQSPEILGKSKEMAVSRLKSMERKFRRDKELKNNYVQFMREYVALNHMKEVKEDIRDNKITYYLPHHAVLKEDSLTTKLRVVFDASAKTQTGVSLNDILYVGPKIQQDLFSLIVRFRTYKYVLTADVTKMYRQVLIKPTQTSLQRIVWRDDEREPIKTFELKTVTYGTATASYLAIKCLQKAADSLPEKYPLGSQVVLNDFYVDDLITGSNSFEDSVKLWKEVSALLSGACFELRKWASNCPKILNDINDDQVENKTIKFDHETCIKTLGIEWNPAVDTFSYSPFNLDISNKITKREILSQISKIFDPLGLITPILIKGKLLMQSLWKLEVSWDERLPLDLCTRWNDFQTNLQNLSNINIK